jgi:hypothetical protein
MICKMNDETEITVHVTDLGIHVVRDANGKLRRAYCTEFRSDRFCGISEVDAQLIERFPDAAEAYQFRYVEDTAWLEVAGVAEILSD